MMSGVLWTCLAVTSLIFVPWPATAQCGLEQSEDVVLGTGTSVRMALDPVTEEPVVIYDTTTSGIVYRHFYGPHWGREVKVDTAGIDLFVDSDGAFNHTLDLVLDRYGRPRVAFLDEAGVYHVRYTSGWSAPETVVDWDLGDSGDGGAVLRLERDTDDRVHLVVWTSLYDGGGRYAFHAFDGGTGFGEATNFDNGWPAHAAADSHGDLHVVSFDAFSDPDNPSGLHQYQVYYWEWDLETGWPTDYAIITDEPNPPDGNGSGPVGFSPEIAVDGSDVPHVAYPMHDTSEATDGEMHYVNFEGGSWSSPVNLFPCNGHGGKPRIDIDHRGTVLVVGLVYPKHFSADFGHGFEEYGTWNSSSSNWQFHDLVNTRGLFWHVFVPVYWADGVPGDITMHTFTKTGHCPDILTSDLDDDGADDSVDLCPGFPDPAQWDTDGDGVGDGCDTDDDDDGVPDSEDVCPRLFDPDQIDSNGDGLGDACSNLVDEDDDGWLASYECDDSEPTAFPGNPEVCDDGIDNDCDGAVDGDDPDCPPGGDDDDDGDGDDDDGEAGDDGSWESGCGCRTAGHEHPLCRQTLVLAFLGLAIGRRLWRSGGPGVSRHQPTRSAWRRRQLRCRYNCR
jgi:hypothetical protein